MAGGSGARLCDRGTPDSVGDRLDSAIQREGDKIDKTMLQAAAELGTSRGERLDQVQLTFGRTLSAMVFLLVFAAMGALFVKFVTMQLQVNSPNSPNSGPAASRAMMDVDVGDPRVAVEPSSANRSTVFVFDTERLFHHLAQIQKNGSALDTASGPVQQKLVGQVPIVAGIYLAYHEKSVVLGLRYGCTDELDAPASWPFTGSTSVSLLNNDNTVAHKWTVILDSIGSCLDPLSYPARRGFISLLPYYSNEEFWTVAVLNGTVAYKFTILS